MRLAFFIVPLRIGEEFAGRSPANCISPTSQARNSTPFECAQRMLFEKKGSPWSRLPNPFGQLPS